MLKNVKKDDDDDDDEDDDEERDDERRREIGIVYNIPYEVKYSYIGINATID